MFLLAGTPEKVLSYKETAGEFLPTVSLLHNKWELKQLIGHPTA